MPRARPALLLLLPICFGACSTPKPTAPSNAPETSTRSLLEDRLLSVLELEQDLDAAAAKEDPEIGQIQRQFHGVAAAYRDLLAFNPDSLETRLLYGKLLSRYGDRDGARDQFLAAARIDPRVAVIHQQLATYYAEEADHTRALAFMLNAVELEPETAAYHFGLGQLLLAFREPFVEEGIYSRPQLETEMLNAFRTAATLSPLETALQFRFGEAAYDVAQPDWPATLAHWIDIENRLALDPLQHDALHVHVARCLIALERLDEARQRLTLVTSPTLQPSAQALLEIISHD
jgi:tetratricopeptide (TPR) repeat protein